MKNNSISSLTSKEIEAVIQKQTNKESATEKTQAQVCSWQNYIVIPSYHCRVSGTNPVGQKGQPKKPIMIMKPEPMKETYFGPDIRAKSAPDQLSMKPTNP